MGGVDANAAEILPTEKREREDKKRVMKEQLIAEQQGEGKMSGKKKKRLDKYIVRLPLAHTSIQPVSVYTWSVTCVETT
jgi:hypothetical protein